MLLSKGRDGIVQQRRGTVANHSLYLCNKIIDKTLLTNPTDRECLEKEAKIMTLLSPHPNIVQIHDVYTSDESLTPMQP